MTSTSLVKDYLNWTLFKKNKVQHLKQYETKVTKKFDYQRQKILAVFFASWPAHNSE